MNDHPCPTCGKTVRWRAKFCSRSCQYLSQAERQTVPIGERLDTQSIPEPNTGCWLWTGYMNRQGYGRLRVGGRSGRMILAHRASWERERGPIPDGLDCLHACDTPLCINPAHLFLGTHADNMADMVRKGRIGGERHAKAKLTWRKVLELRERRREGETYNRMAKELGMTRQGVRSAVLFHWRGPYA